VNFRTLFRRLTPLVLVALVCAGAADGRTTAPSLYVATTGSDGGQCTRTAPCRTFDRAYAVARPGQIVEVAGGVYGDEDVNAHGARSGSAVVFRPAAGQRVVVDDIDVKATRVEFRNLTIRTWETHPTARDVTFRGIRNNGFWIVGSTNIRVLGGSVGPGVDVHSIIQGGGPTSNILIERVSFHDWTRTSPSVHTECLQIAGGNGIVVRRSRFWNCAVMDIHVTHWGEAPLTRNVTIENNFLDDPIDGFYAVLAGDYDNLLLRNNSSLGGFSVLEGNGGGQNIRMIANVAPLSPWECKDSVTYRYNVWTRGACSSTDRRAVSSFRDPTKLDLRLKPNAAAVDRGDPTSAPAVDIDGQRRPGGRAPDAGADETG
jgi:hypothetical protein